MNKKLGIDLGSASCGWAIRKDNEIINKGVVTFSTGMVKGKGGYSSPTQDRRKSRSKRRLIQARKYRKWELLKILILNNLVPLKSETLELWSKYQKGVQRKFPETKEFLQWLSCDFNYENGEKYKNPYEIRVKGLEGKLTKHEFGRALYHIIQRRGYKDIGEKDEETKKQIERREGDGNENGFKAAMQKHKFISKALQKEFLDKGKRARNEYPFRDEYQDEFELLCKTQGFDSSKEKKGEYSNEFVQKLWKAIIWQRPLRSQKDKVGRCTLEPTSPRIPVSHPLFEIFRTLQYINTIKTVDKNGKKTQIPKEYRNSLLIDEFMKRDSNFKFSIIKTYLDKKFQRKMEYNYLNKRTEKYDSTVSGMPVCKNFIDLFGRGIITNLLNLIDYNKASEIPKTIKGYSLHDLWHIIFNSSDVSFLKDFAEKMLKIDSTSKEKNGVEIRENKFADIQKVFRQGYSDMSAKAIRKIIPFLQDGKLYNEAVVLAKIPELLGDNWESKKEEVLNSIEECTNLYNFNSDIINIVNGLINAYKGLDYNEVFAYKDTEYLLVETDIDDIEKSCIKYFGEKTWKEKKNKEAILNDVKKEYQSFFKDSKRTYRVKVTHTELVTQSLKSIGIELNGELYHHSNKKNIYPKPIFSKKYKQDILAVPLIDSIKNPMFNKAMTILRKLINELIIKGEIDADTEIIVEVARELNDNNKRAAIEKYQKERERNREKYREFIKEFNSQKNRKINVSERIDDFELWTEQIFDENQDKKIDDKVSNRLSILKEKKDIDRYELWTEQKGQCMYTGKMISITQLFSTNIEIEHTIPRSLLPDNTKANQTVCFSKYNSDVKNNKIPFECPNYAINDTNGSAIEPRLATWQKLKDRYKELYDKNKRAKGNEDENTKNKRIQNKHYYRMHLEYWSDKLNRFTCEEIKESWARRQLADTQMVSKYAREFLKTYFKKVNVEKGIITAQFRKIYGFQEEDEIKSRNKHTHHAIDAAVLTLIPNNASKKKALLEKSYEKKERREGQYTTSPCSNFNAQELITNIEGTTLIFNYKKDKIISQTYKKVRKRSEVQKTKNGSIKWMKGDSIRGDLYGQTFLSKIKDVERHENGQPKRENGDWKYKKGNNEFTYATKKPINEVKSKYIKDIIDPDIKKLVENQKKNEFVYDRQGNKIRHVRVKVKKGRVVKERVNYKSKNEHKNFYYASAGEIPYAVMLEKIIGNKIERKMIPIAIHEVAKVFKEHRKFTADLYLNFFHNKVKVNYNNWRLLSVGQKVLVLQNDNEIEEVADISFQKNRFYYIKKFYGDGEGGIYLKYHLEATKDDDIDKLIKLKKDKIIAEYDKKFELNEIVEDLSELDVNKRKKEFNDRKFKFVGIKDFRFSRLIPHLGEEKVKELIKNLKVYSKQSSKIKKEGETPLLKTGINDCNFLYEGEHFEMDILGNINVLVDNL